jgi:hypothetical protein
VQRQALSIQGKRWSLYFARSTVMLHKMDSAPTIRDLFPSLPDDKLAQIEDAVEQYLALVIRIYERIRSDPMEYAKFRRLTGKTQPR